MITRRRRASSASAPQPIVTLLTDFGTADWYVGVLKATVLRNAPQAQLIDITHEVAPGDVLSASINLHAALDAFPDGTVHLAVVDPGVGTQRRLLVAWVNNQWVVCPDNGLITWAADAFGATLHELTWRPMDASATFHGRDILAPVAAMLASGTPIETISSPAGAPVLLAQRLTAPGARAGAIVHFDRFGNAMTNIRASVDLAAAKRVRVGDRTIESMGRTYHDVAAGQPVIVINSCGLLEIAVRDRSAREVLGLSLGQSVTWE